MKTVYLAGGCFWGTQKFFDQFAGVLETEVGYANGPTANPSYQDVCAGSGHAETYAALRLVFPHHRSNGIPSAGNGYGRSVPHGDLLH